MPELYPMQVVATGRLGGIAVRRAARAPMSELANAQLSVAGGVAGDHRGRPGRRQVSVLGAEGWAAALAAIASTEARVALPWTARRANLLVHGLDLAGRVACELRIGPAVRLQVTGETDPCGRMDEAVPGLRVALGPDWRGGVTCRVLADGGIAIGDVVTLWSSRPR